jgi:hypothetical protein
VDVNSGGLGLWFENQMNRLDASRIRRLKQFPEAIERPYWNDDAFAEDSVRLEALGYSVESETHTDGYVNSSYPANTGGGFGQLTRTITRARPRYTSYIGGESSIDHSMPGNDLPDAS